MQSMLVAHFDNFLFLLLVVVAVLFQFLAKVAGKKNKDQTKRTSTPRTPAPSQRAPTGSDEDRIRKLMEALGQPPTARPPPPVVPRTDISPRPLAPVKPPIPQAPPPWRLPRKERGKPEAIAKEKSALPVITRVEKIIPPKITGSPAFEIQEAPEAYAATTRTISKTEERRADIATLLTSTSGLRDAVILREILGPPRGLRAIEAML
jgi:hypothetical protein